MRATAESNTVPGVTTIESRLADAKGHRVDETSAQYRRITGETVADSDPEAICNDLAERLRSNEDEVRETIDTATDEFDGIVLDDLEAVFETVWRGEELSESDIVGSTLIQQAETYAIVRELFDDSDDASLWSQLGEAARMLRSEHPDTLTRESVDKALASPIPPTPTRTEELIKEAEDPIVGDTAWEQLKAVSDELDEELPNADLTQTVTSRVEADDKPSEERARELLAEANKLLERLRTVNKHLDSVNDGSIVVIE